MTWRGRHIFLVGLPGAGKSSIGKELADLLPKSNYRFIDIDEEIILRTGKKIEDIFSEPDGENIFRELETVILLEIAEKAFDRQPYIIATGGGTPLRAINRSLMRGSGVTVWVDVTVKQAAKNILKSLLGGETRPLLRSSNTEELTEKLRALHVERLPFYEQSTLHFVTRSPRGDERSTSELAEELLKALEQMSRKILLRPRFELYRVHSALGDYPITIGSGIAAQELAFALGDMNARRVVVITDENVQKTHATKFYEKLQKECRQSIDLHQIVLPPGERSKDQKTLFELLDSFGKLELQRKSDVIVTFGGGVVSDVGGLAASLYHRGIRVIHIPTTLIGQADAAIGGKTGIDHFGKKNTIGAFYAPHQVVIDPLFLKTLPKRELHAGLAEIIKYGLIGSSDLWQTCAKSFRRLLRGYDSGYEIIIRDAVREKNRYIEKDEFERVSGVRELLNFGHTFAHAFESATGFTELLHGEAVALGMRAAAWLSMDLGMLPESEWRNIEHVLGRFPTPSSLEISVDAVLPFLLTDKKHKGDGLRLVLLENIGKAIIKEGISMKKAREAIEFVTGVI